MEGGAWSKPFRRRRRLRTHRRRRKKRLRAHRTRLKESLTHGR